jgi:hypothetical protein
MNVLAVESTTTLTKGGYEIIDSSRMVSENKTY